MLVGFYPAREERRTRYDNPGMALVATHLQASFASVAALGPNSCHLPGDCFLEEDMDMRHTTEGNTESGFCSAKAVGDAGGGEEYPHFGSTQDVKHCEMHVKSMQNHATYTSHSVNTMRVRQGGSIL